MAKPRVFVSSTYYDLRHIRQGLEAFVMDMGYEPVLFESGDIPFAHDKPLDESCYKEITTCHLLVLIIGGRFGSATSSTAKSIEKDELERQYQHYNSITQKEFETAIESDIPVYIFIENAVNAEYDTFKKNRHNTQVSYAHVDSVNIFHLLDGIYSQRRNNLTREFDKLSDITSWLRDQWADLFADFLSRKTADRQLMTMTMQLSRLENVSGALKDYSESMIRGMAPTKAESIIKDTEDKLRQRTKIDLFTQNDMIRHFNQIHGISIDKLYNFYSKSKTFPELQRKLKSVLENKGEECKRIESSSTNQLEFNSLRTILELSPSHDEVSDNSSLSKLKPQRVKRR